MLCYLKLCFTDIVRLHRKTLNFHQKKKKKPNNKKTKQLGSHPFLDKGSQGKVIVITE